MKTLAIVCVVLWVLGWLLYKAADRPGDDFGAGVFAWLMLFAAFVCTLVLAVWAAVRYLGWT